MQVIIELSEKARASTDHYHYTSAVAVYEFDGFQGKELHVRKANGAVHVYPYSNIQSVRLGP